MTTAYILISLVLLILGFVRNVNMVGKPSTPITDQGRKVSACIQGFLIVLGSAAILFGSAT